MNEKVEEGAKAEETVKAEEAAKAEDTAKAVEAAKPEEAAKTEEATKAEEAAKPNAHEVPQPSEPALNDYYIDYTLAGAIRYAELLLTFTAEQGKQVDQNVIEAIVHSRSTFLKGGVWNEEDEKVFWDAYRSLCDAAKPVSPESLEAAKPRKKVTFFRRREKPAPSAARAAVRHYQVTTVIALLVLLVFQVYWVFVSTLVNDLNRIEKEIAKMNVEFLTKSSELDRLVDEKNRNPSDERNRPLEENIARLQSELAPFKSGGHPDLLLLYAQYKSNLHLLEDTNILGMAFSEGEAFSDEFEDIETYEEAAEYERYQQMAGPLLIQTAAISLEVFSLYFLPILYGLVGACAYVLRTISRQVRERTFTTASKIRLQLRVVLGALAGLSIAWFFPGKNGVDVFEVTGLSEHVAPLALAFLAGYSVELLFSAMDALIGAFTRGRASDGAMPP